MAAEPCIVMTRCAPGKEDSMIYAEKKHEGSEQGYNHIRYLVYNGDVIGTYTLNIDPHGRVYAASRDFHRIATPQEIADHEAYQSYLAMDDDEQEAYDNEHGGGQYTWHVEVCPFHDDKLCICDGSSLVEVADNDQRAFEIAAMMAWVER